MRTASPNRSVRSGFTLIEMTLVLSVLLALIAVTFFGVNAFKAGTNRAMCIQNIASAQRAARAFGHFYGVEPGENVDSLTDKLIGPGKFLPIMPICPAGGVYTIANDGNSLPELGTAFLKCSIEDHVHEEHGDW